MPRHHRPALRPADRRAAALLGQNGERGPDVRRAGLHPRPAAFPGRARRRVQESVSTIASHPKLHHKLIVCALIRGRHASFYPAGARGSDSFARVVSKTQFGHLRGMVAATEGAVVLGGIDAATGIDETARFFPPTLVRDVGKEDALMRECVCFYMLRLYATDSGADSREIFGPVLPIVPVDDIDEALAIVTSWCAVLKFHVPLAHCCSVANTRWRYTSSRATHNSRPKVSALDEYESCDADVRAHFSV